MDVDRARVAVRRVAPDPRQQHVAREHAARAAGERREDLELDERQLGVVAADADRALGEVDPQLADDRAAPRRVPSRTGRLISARRSAALIRLENSRSENGLVM